MPPCTGPSSWPRSPWPPASWPGRPIAGLPGPPTCSSNVRDRTVRAFDRAHSFAATPTDVAQGGGRPTMPETACLHIQARDSDPIRVVELAGVSVRIGRASYCEVRLPAPELADEECCLRRRGAT